MVMLALTGIAMVRPEVTVAIPLEFRMCVARILAGLIDYAVSWSFTVALADPLDRR